MSTELRSLFDKTLAYVLEQLERKVQALRDITTAVGMALYQQCRERLDAAKAEQERRRC
jgi:hypothetical protein